MPPWTFWIIGCFFAPWLVCWGFWLLLVLLAWGPRHRRRDVPWHPEFGVHPIDVLIPAHNEEAALPALLASLGKQNAPEGLGRVLVVADHCTDQTAALARRAGFEALERNTGPAGKPGALRDGLAHLRAGKHGAAVLFIDADCIATDNLIGQMAWGLAAGHAVSQSAYILEKNSDGLAVSVWSGFALKNLVRPTGLDRLGLPCQLFGTGMMLRWDILERVKFEDHLVEDLRMSHTLLLEGIYPKFMPQVTLVSAMPRDKNALTKQRLRWEGGQMQIWKQLPGLVLRLAARARVRALLALIDWSAPPLALMVAGWALFTAATAALAAFRVVPVWALAWPALAAAFLGLYLTVGITAAGGVAGLAALLSGAPGYMMWKVQVYVGMLRGTRAKSWERTPRGTEATTQQPLEKPT